MDIFQVDFSNINELQKHGKTEVCEKNISTHCVSTQRESIITLKLTL